MDVNAFPIIDAIKAAEEITRLRAENAELREISKQLMAAADAVLAKVELAVVDAERYRWLRDTDGNVSILHDDGKFSLPDWQGISFTWRRRAWRDGKPLVVCDGLDAAVDAARAAQGERG